jgi:hypothetical protein
VELCSGGIVIVEFTLWAELTLRNTGMIGHILIMIFANRTRRAITQLIVAQFRKEFGKRIRKR